MLCKLSLSKNSETSQAHTLVAGFSEDGWLLMIWLFKTNGHISLGRSGSSEVVDGQSVASPESGAGSDGVSELYIEFVD
jgi:hypothetical protein